MVIGNVEFINDVGERTVKEIRSTNFYVELEGQQLSPAITDEVELESNNQTTTTHDQCGNMERQKSATDGELIRITGIVSAERREGNLDLRTLINEVTKGSTVTVGCALFSGEIVVSNRVVTQSSDLIKIETPDSNGKEDAFSFQLQLGEDEADN